MTPRPVADAGLEQVNLAQIARMAGTARVAVVNWRRRSPDFPEPVGGTGDSPLFDGAAARAWVAASPLVVAARTSRRRTLARMALEDGDAWAWRMLTAEYRGSSVQVRVWPPSG